MWWLFWIVIALIALAGEAVTTALVLACFGVAAILVSPLALALPVPAQIIVFSVLSIGLLVGARPTALRFFPAGDSSKTLPRTLEVGRQGTVVQRVDANSGQIRIGSGEFWSARTGEPGVSISPGRDVAIVRMDGLTAVVEPVGVVRSEAHGSGPIPYGLSAREVEVLQLVSLGLSNQEIADRLFLSPRTVHHHVSHILNKMNAASRVEAVRLGIEQGLVRPNRSDS